MTDRRRPSRCPAVTAAGGPCRGRPLDSGWCFAHDPNLDARRADARRRGGRNSAAHVRAAASMPEPIAEAMRTVRASLAAVHRGDAPAARGHAVAALARALAALWDVHCVEARLDDIEDHLAGVTVAPDRLRAVE